MMGRVRELGSADDVFELAARLDWVRPVIDFAHLHAVSDGASSTPRVRRRPRTADALLEPGARSTSTSRTSPREPQRDEPPPYGEGTLRAEPLREALARFDRPATVISESPDEESHQAIMAILLGSRV